MLIDKLNKGLTRIT